jgi:hypothetical protein
MDIDDMRTDRPPVFEVRFGHRAEGEPDMRVLATYAMRGFADVADSGISRHDQAMEAMDDLALPEGVNWLEIERRKQDAAELVTSLRAVTRSGIIADLVGADSAAVEQDPSLRLAAQPANVPPAFPVESIFNRPGLKRA